MKSIGRSQKVKTKFAETIYGDDKSSFEFTFFSGFTRIWLYEGIHLMRPLPKSPTEITTEWITAVLHKSGALQASAEVSEIVQEPLGEGVGMLSELALLTLSYTGDADEAPSTLVVKFPTLNVINRGIAKDFRVYQREVRSYLEIVPNSPAASPKVHLADIEGDGDFVIILEDLSDYRVGDQVEGATFEESGLAVKELAKLHGTFWGKVDSEEFEWMPRFSNSWNATNMLEGSQASWELASENFDEWVPQWIRDIKGDFLKTLPALQKHLDTKPITIVHGDLRLDNLFFGQEPHHHKMTFIDWQGPVRGRGVVDVAFLLCQSTKTEVRRAHEKELMQQYLDALEAQGVSGYSVDEAWEDYRVAVLYQWCFATLVAGSMDPTNDRGNAWITEMVKRNVAAIEDLNCLDLL